MTAHYKHAIWDWNGTLLNDTWLCVEVLNGLLAIRKRDVGSAAADTDGETVRIPPTPTHLRVPAAAIARFLDSYAHFANAWRRGRASASSR